MLLRCASRLAAGPAMLAGGLVLATGLAATLTLGAGVAGALLLGRRLREERKGWRDGADTAPPEAADIPTS
jgi:hypothetical protein